MSLHARSRQGWRQGGCESPHANRTCAARVQLHGLRALRRAQRDAELVGVDGVSVQLLQRRRLAAAQVEAAAVHLLLVAVLAPEALLHAFVETGQR
jgi:hypothetical protein